MVLIALHRPSSLLSFDVRRHHVNTEARTPALDSAFEGRTVRCQWHAVGDRVCEGRKAHGSTGVIVTT